MTIAEINALTVQDILEEILMRLDLEVDPEDGTLEVELILVKNEMIVVETERLRREDWRNRFKSIKDMRMVSFDAGYTGVANLKVWARDSINENDETILLALEVQEPITTARLAQDVADESASDQEVLDAILQLKNLDWSSVTTIAKMRTVLKKTLKILLK